MNDSYLSLQMQVGQLALAQSLPVNQMAAVGPNLESGISHFKTNSISTYCGRCGPAQAIHAPAYTSHARESNHALAAQERPAW